MVDEITGGQITQVGIGLTFGLAVGAMVHATGHISGAHINPAVTLGLAIAGRFPWRHIPSYWTAQLAGASMASLALWLIIGRSADMGATVPSGSALESLGLEMVLTFILMFVIMAAATDPRTRRHSAALAIGATVGLEALFAGPISGASMNPARSFAPALVGWVWQDHWLYWVGPITGALAASAVYSWLRHDGARSRTDPPSTTAETP